VTVLAVEPLPPVSGQHRNRALAAQRRTRALKLIAQGQTYQQVADYLGYANRGTVHRLVSQALASQQVEAVGSLRELEGARLDALQVSLWETAMQGDLAAIRAVLRIIAARTRLFGLQDTPDSRPGHPAWDNCAGPSTVVVREDDCRWQGCAIHGRFET